MTNETREQTPFVVAPQERPPDAVDLPVGVEHRVKVRGRSVRVSRPRPTKRTVAPSETDVEVANPVRQRFIPDGCDSGIVIVLRPGDRVTRRLAKTLGIDESSGPRPLTERVGRRLVARKP